MDLEFLPIMDGWLEGFALAKSLSGEPALVALRALAGSQLSFTQVGKIDRAITQTLHHKRADLSMPAIRLAIIGSATISHLSPAIRVAGLRRGFLVDIYEGDYGMYMQELADEGSALHRFKPEVLLIALDAHHLAENRGGSAEDSIILIEQAWALAKKNLMCVVLQQTILPVFPPYLGNNEQRLCTSPSAIVDHINASLRQTADVAGVHLLALDRFFQTQGLSAWYEPALWYRSKHEVHPRAAIVYGDQVARELAALRGLSSKCLVLDLDNTLWGGVIGDDGLEGIILGQGSAVGEAFVGFQRYCEALWARGVLLAVCSKNDESNARLPFQKHPDMILREEHIACFVANWVDKASNLRDIAARLNIGIDSIVFADDNPAERSLVRRELPLVQVPELPEDPALYADMIASAGYFESLSLTSEDQKRNQQYIANSERARLLERVTDVESYLRSLRMELTIEPFTEIGLARVTQLINKTNQFNVTTRRYLEVEARSLMESRNVVTITARLADKFGDNGMISVVIARVEDPYEVVIDTWLMSCRVLGRRVEDACLDVLVAACEKRGVKRLVGIYKPTAKNSMVSDLYTRLGFAERDVDAQSGERRFMLEVSRYKGKDVPMSVHNLLEALPVLSAK